MLIDFHNHHLSSSPDVLSIRSFHQREQELFAQWAGPCSVGLHPWFVSEVDGVQDEQWDWLVRVAREEKVLLLGECGLDKLQGPDLVYQQFVFEHCLSLAEQLQKPMVIHCVRAYEELFTSVQKIKPTVPLVIHGFARKVTVLKPLLERGFYVSYGAAILHPNSAAAQSLAQTPLEKLFLESDDKMLPIADLYARAAQIKGMSIQELEIALQNNLNRLLRQSKQ
ncbi:TatD family hydrolase [Haliscomenobacter sp.]|uniref:TatD family hydrolase n=1 Tax=Haliscomenobacter sp. TaxID=2717303 RepID=UPI0035936533